MMRKSETEKVKLNPDSPTNMGYSLFYMSLEKKKIELPA